MISLHAFPKGHDTTGGATGGRLRRALTQRHFHNLSPYSLCRVSSSLPADPSGCRQLASRRDVRAAASFILDALDHPACQLSDLVHRHMSVLLQTRFRLLVDLSESKLTDAKIFFAEKQKTHD